MGRKAKKRRQSHGSAWHWKQTDCWYYTRPGTKKRVPLFDEQGERIRGKENRESAEVALAREKLTWQDDSAGAIAGGEWLVARVCSEYLQYCEQGLAKGSISQSHRNNSRAWLNDLCGYCGALPVPQLKKGHVQKWMDDHPTWKSPATRAGVISVVQAAFNRAAAMYGVANPIKGLKKPKAEPRLASLTPDDEQAIYGATERCFEQFLFAAIHTGLRPFCELATITADDVEEMPRGMMWRVYSSKTKKTRKIPVRPEVAELTRTLMKTAPKGSGLPLFRNTHGNPWKRTTGVVRFITIKKKLGWDQDPVKGNYSCYTCRHTFVHRMLSGYWTEGMGCSIETLAELIGDTPKVAFNHYGREWGQHYQDPLWNAIGEGGNRRNHASTILADDESDGKALRKSTPTSQAPRKSASSKESSTASSKRSRAKE
ncbi:tyrosine-type recombinase/integrase [Thalassoroseus pseudoceratinae]|uniref:tyrosine-type recombinase/integrase n=1 Tax=Thalassoroseus pseudoceratinae TaxID=2713176 RepID=UPI0019802730|nr:tyrosine-type recombinase/integrase [Thalassoroseus pseudoceratinae]